MMRLKIYLNLGWETKKGGDLFSGRGPSLESKVKSAFTRHFNSTGKVSAGQLATMSKQADRDKLLIKQKKKEVGGAVREERRRKQRRGGRSSNSQCTTTMHSSYPGTEGRSVCYSGSTSTPV